MTRIRDALAIILFAVLLASCGRPADHPKIDEVKTERMYCWRVDLQPWRCEPVKGDRG